MVAYAGLNPSHHRSGSSIDRPTRISKIGMLSCGRRFTCRRCPQCASILLSRPSSRALRAPSPPAQADRGGGHAQTPGSLLWRAEGRASGLIQPSPCQPELRYFPIPLFDWGRSFRRPDLCPIGRRAQRRSRRVVDPRAIARLVLDCSEHAGMLRQIDTGFLDWTSEHGIYRNQRNTPGKMAGSLSPAIACDGSPSAAPIRGF